MEDEENLHRPNSCYYENSSAKNNHNTNNNKECKFADSPTQTVFLNTTVPQNIARQDIGGKHAPTRNSLRHSRMIVLNKAGQITATDKPPFLQHCKLVKFSRILVVTLGLCLSILSLWLMLWSPNIRSRDNPYWNAGPALVSGVIGWFFVKTCLKLYTTRNVTYWIKSLKGLSILSSSISLLASSAICILSVIHLVSLYHLQCAPPDKLNITCICKNNFNGTDSVTIFPDYHYVDLNCFEVNNVLSAFSGFISIVSGLLILLEGLYLYLHWVSRKVYMYTRVPVNGNVFETTERWPDI